VKLHTLNRLLEVDVADLDVVEVADICLHRRLETLDNSGSNLILLLYTGDNPLLKCLTNLLSVVVDLDQQEHSV